MIENMENLPKEEEKVNQNNIKLEALNEVKEK